MPAVGFLRRLGWPVVGLAALLAVLAAGLGRDVQALPSALVGKPAPAFSLARLEAPERNLSSQELRGQPWVFNVWASWCASCRQEHTTLLNLAKRQLAPIVGLDYMDTAAEGRRWLAEHGNPYTHTVQDPKGRTGIDYGVVGVPETFVVDAQGVVRLKIAGPLTEQVVAQQIVPLLQELRRGRP